MDRWIGNLCIKKTKKYKVPKDSGIVRVVKISHLRLERTERRGRAYRWRRSSCGRPRDGAAVRVNSDRGYRTGGTFHPV